MELKYNRSFKVNSLSEVEGAGGGGGVLTWAARHAFKSWPHFRPKKVVFYALFQTKIKKSI